MKHDHISAQIQICGATIEELRQMEIEIESLRDEEKKQCQSQAKSKRLEILQQAETSSVCMFLEAAKLSGIELPDAEAFRSQWKQDRKNYSHEKDLREWHLKDIFEATWKKCIVPDLNALPRGSFFITLTFTLDEPYISRDDNAFYVIENPVRHDKVFRVPYIAPSAWKGNLILALHHSGIERNHSTIIRLFGNEKQEDKTSENFRRGCLNFFPTFFYEAGLEIINPQSRTRKAGTVPILFETVPSNSAGIFNLLYVPFHRIGCEEADAQQKSLKEEVAEDLDLVVKGLRAMFRTYGFSAKRTSGFGSAREEVINGEFMIRFDDIQPTGKSDKAVSVADLPRYLKALDQLRPEYLNLDGTFRHRTEDDFVREEKGKKKTGKKKIDKEAWQLYQKAQSWWERRQRAQSEKVAEPPKIETKPTLVLTKQWIKERFMSFTELVNEVEVVAARLRGGA